MDFQDLSTDLAETEAADSEPGLEQHPSSAAARDRADDGNLQTSDKRSRNKNIPECSPEEYSKWVSALKEENRKLRQRVKELERLQNSETNPERNLSQQAPSKAPNGTLSAAYGFVGCRVRPKDAAKAEVWGAEAAPAALRSVEGGGSEWESQPTVGFKPIGYIESCFLDKNGTPRQLDGIEDSTLLLSGVDIIHGSPVLDVKPYIPFADSAPPAEIRQPDWMGPENQVPELSVKFEAGAVEQLKGLEGSFSFFRDVDQATAAITGVLRGDPRSVHLRKSADFTLASGKRFVFAIDSVDVHCAFDGLVATVCEVVPVYMKLRQELQRAMADSGLETPPPPPPAGACDPDADPPAPTHRPESASSD